MLSRDSRACGNEGGATITVPGDDEQRMHIFHELIVGAYLARGGFNIDYERPVDGKTPDWTLIKEGAPEAIIEVHTHHLGRSLEKYLEERLLKREPTVYYPENQQKMFGALDDKAGCYDALATSRAIPFVVAIFTKWEVCASPENIKQVIYGQCGIFGQRPALSGVLFVRRERGSRFCFDYFPNLIATCPLALSAERWDGH